jgi:hypothetical protein
MNSGGGFARSIGLYVGYVAVPLEGLSLGNDHLERFLVFVQNSVDVDEPIRCPFLPSQEEVYYKKTFVASNRLLI